MHTVPGCANCARSPPNPFGLVRWDPQAPLLVCHGEQIPDWRLEQQVGDTVGWGHDGSLALGHAGRRLVTAPTACWGVMTSW